MGLIEDNGVVKEFSTDAAYESFGDAVLPGALE